MSVYGFMLGKVRGQDAAFAALTDCPIVYTALDQVCPKLDYLVVGNSKSQSQCFQLAVEEMC